MSEPSSGSMQSAIIRHIDREVVEGRSVLGDHFRACWDNLCFPSPFSPLILLPLFPSLSCKPFLTLLLCFFCVLRPLSLLGATTGADDVMSSVQFDRQQLTTTWRRAVVFAVHTSPIKQFGIGLGIGWWVGLLAFVFPVGHLTLMVAVSVLWPHTCVFLVGFQGTYSRESVELQHSWWDALL